MNRPAMEAVVPAFAYAVEAVLPQSLPDAVQRRKHISRYLQRAPRLAQVSERSAGEEGRSVGHGFGAPAARAKILTRTRFRCGVVYRPDDLRTRDAVDGRMVHFEEQCEATRREPLDIVETFDHVGFPERVRAVQRARVQPCDLDAELAPVARLGQSDMAPVEFQIEIR